MRRQSIPFRLMSAIAIGGMLLGSGAISPAWAQTDNPPDAGAPAADPPGRVGRLANITGTVSFHGADQTDWQVATLNYPVTSGNAFWTEPGASAAIEVGSTHLAMGPGTEFDITTLDDHMLVATAPQGTVYMRISDVGQGDSYQIATPRGTVTIAQPGRYAINAGDTDNPTTITVDSGAAQVAGPGLSAPIAAHQTVVITGTDSFQATVGAEQADPALVAMLGPETPPPPPAGAVAPPAVVAQMTGGEAVHDSGTWAVSPAYGQVWYPPVAAGWAPYREGHWAFIAPWGWTWVDDAPWGFAPFHYGRWVEDGPRWGWVPAEVGIGVPVVPVYAPALVGFIGFGAGVGIGIGLGASVGWVPLGPREPYYPPYRHSDGYVRNINAGHVRNFGNFGNGGNIPPNRLANFSRATVVPTAAMTGSQPIGRHVQPVTPQTLAAARPVSGAPVRPTATTAGVTPAVARQLNLPPAAAAARPVAPGPAVQPHPAGVTPLRPPGGAPRAVPVTAHQAAPGPAIAPRPPAAAGNAALPPLRPTAPAAAAPVGPRSHPQTPAPSASIPHAAPGPQVTPQVARPASIARPAEPQVQHAAPPVAQPVVPQVQHRTATDPACCAAGPARRTACAACGTAAGPTCGTAAGPTRGATTSAARGAAAGAARGTAASATRGRTAGPACCATAAGAARRATASGPARRAATATAEEKLSTRKTVLLTRASWRRLLLDALLLPAALVVVVFEDVVWAGAAAVLRALARLPPFRKLHHQMGRLPGWAAVPLFLIPEGAARAGEVWAVALLLRGHTVSFLLVYALVRVFATLLAVLVYQACKPALLQIAWFATLVDWTAAVRDWALSQVQPLRDRVIAIGRLAPGVVGRRFTAVRRWVARQLGCGRSRDGGLP